MIAWLLGKSPFLGCNGLRPGNVAAPSWREIDFDLARQSAAIIQFFEQAFEWGNLNYVLYPYYWADRERWDTLNEVSAANPDLERFLKPGSARVVVPARPAMASAVLHWLAFREPFLGRPLPLPGDPLFVSLAQEIRDLTQPPTDRELGDSWEARVGTSLMWLEDTDTLPVVARRAAARTRSPVDPGGLTMANAELVLLLPSDPPPGPPVAPAEQKKQEQYKGTLENEEHFVVNYLPVQNWFGTGKNEPMDIAIPSKEPGLTSVLRREMLSAYVLHGRSGIWQFSAGVFGLDAYTDFIKANGLQQKSFGGPLTGEKAGEGHEQERR